MITIRKNGHGEWKHLHQLEWNTDYQNTFKCDGCKELGIGPRYRCDRCDYNLHKLCHEVVLQHSNSTTSTRIAHDHFPGDTFEFLPFPPHTPSGRFCDACGKRVCGFVYHCKEKGWDLHPCCSNLETKIHVDGTDFFLNLPLTAVGSSGAVSCRKNCLWCRKRSLKGTKEWVPGWSYVSSCGDYRVHVYCLTEILIEAWKKMEMIKKKKKGNTNNSDVGSSINLKELARKNSRSRGDHGFLWKAALFVRTLVGLIFGDPTVVFSTIFLDLLTR
ncbi:uncharacterized protein LOC124933056 [Impatiens glandulifera]|uniref:uncharacterized protein LOC124933056 n=1 Tax=Impatiens glandulifera TaxID=253017 RepID=UPI001FB188EC|nr:uncharacterized protein LOC124933056 [Impatiens glandulifera]